MPRKKSKARKIEKPNHNQIDKLVEEIVKKDNTDEIKQAKQEKIK